MGNRCHPANPYFTFRIYFPERFDQGEIVRDEVIPIVRPVARIGVVESEMDNNQVACKIESCPVFLLFAVRTVSFVQ